MTAVDRTGVEMEALVAVTVAALTVWDMVKAVDAGLAITDVTLVSKTGGKSGAGPGMTAGQELVRAIVGGRARHGRARGDAAGRARGRGAERHRRARPRVVGSRGVGGPARTRRGRCCSTSSGCSDTTFPSRRVTIVPDDEGELGRQAARARAQFARAAGRDDREGPARVRATSCRR